MTIMKATIMTATFCALLLGCGKSNKNPCGTAEPYYGGVGGGVSYFYRVFYQAQDFHGGAVIIRVKDKNGTVINPNSPQLVNYFPNNDVTCSFNQGVVRVQLQTGQDYTWQASDMQRGWKGTIQASCVANSCETIQLK